MEIIDKPTPAQRAAVYRIFRQALQQGELTRPDCCAWCGATEEVIEGHHPDYSRPLMVVWLCHGCHSRHHAKYAIERRLFKYDA